MHIQKGAVAMTDPAYYGLWLVAALLVSSLSASTEPAQAFETTTIGQSGNTISYMIMPSSIPFVNASRVSNADAAWSNYGISSLRNLNKIAYSCCATPRTIINKKTLVGAAGLGTLGCNSHLAIGKHCTIYLNTGTNWYTGTSSSIPSGQRDQWSTLVHEMGHWHGLGHSTYKPLSDSNNPSMYSGLGGSSRRSVQQDDVNGLMRIHSTYNRITANPEFEYGSMLFWDKRKNSQGNGTHVLKTSGGSNGPKYVQMTNGGSGNNVSVRQEIRAIDNSYGGTPLAGITGYVQLRAPQGAVLATMVVWDLSTGTPYASSCLVTSTSSWVGCWAPQFPKSGIGEFHVMVEIYNTHPSRQLDIDFLQAYM